MQNFISLVRCVLKSNHYKLNEQLVLEKEAELIKMADEYYQQWLHPVRQKKCFR